MCPVPFEQPKLHREPLPELRHYKGKLDEARGPQIGAPEGCAGTDLEVQF